jgi:NADH dehydrogenase [ubiquinone] 1 alpha subcomplex assembly factor 2
MSRLWARFAGLFSSKSFIGVDKTGNKYFSRMEEIDGFVKEKRWVKFRREEDPTSIPVEWICWLNGQRKRAPTPEEMIELEARRERVKLNVARRCFSL